MLCQDSQHTHLAVTVTVIHRNTTLYVQSGRPDPHTHQLGAEVDLACQATVYVCHNYVLQCVLYIWAHWELEACHQYYKVMLYQSLMGRNCTLTFRLICRPLPVVSSTLNMANRTAKDAKSVKGTNPQYLVEKIIRTRIYDCKYWKEQCFGLTGEGEGIKL